MDISYGPELRLGRSTAYLARVLLTKLEDPNSPRHLRDHINPLCDINPNHSFQSWIQ